MKIAGLPSLVILAQAMYPCQEDKDGSCELIWLVLHPGLSEGSFGNKGRLGRTGQIATAGVTSFQCHGR